MIGLEVIQTKYKIWREQKSLELRSIELAKNQLEEAATYAQRDDDTGWEMLYSASKTGTGDVLSEDTLDAARSQSRKFARWNPHARAILRSLVKFVIGRGLTFAPKFPKEVSDDVKKEWMAHWDKWVKAEKFLKKQKECIRRLTRDGEFFLEIIDDLVYGLPKIRFLDPGRIRNPKEYTDGKVNGKVLAGNLTYGIETSKKDIEKVFYYYYVNDDGSQKRRIPAKNLIHKKLFADSDRKRGFPFLETMLFDLKSYRDWLKDRIILNKIRTAIALVREVQPGMGTKSQIKSLRDATKATIPGTKSTKLQVPEAGTMLTAKGFTYKFLTPNLAAEDSAHDGRNILLTVAAGSGLPEYMVTGDASNANYSSSMVAESPGVKEFEDIQDESKDAYIEIWDRVMANAAKSSKDVPDTDPPTCDLTFPVLIARDIKKEADAFTALHQERIQSRKTIRGKLGLNNEIEDKNFEDELNDELEWNTVINPEPEKEEPEGGEEE